MKKQKIVMNKSAKKKTQQRKQFALRIPQFREFLYSSGACWYTSGKGPSRKKTNIKSFTETR